MISNRHHNRKLVKIQINVKAHIDHTNPFLGQRCAHSGHYGVVFFGSGSNLLVEAVPPPKVDC